MTSKILVSCVLASVIVAPALAQQQRPATTPAPAAAATSTTVTHTDQWRASKLIGVNVYNDQNEKLGAISEIILDKSGKAAGVVIGVGGFLGMGKHDIMAKFSELKFVDEPVRTSATTTTTTTRPATTGASNTAPRQVNNEQKWYPDHAILNATKDQLKSMPEFKY